MFKSLFATLKKLSWFSVIAIILFVVSLVYMLIGMLGLAIYYVMASLFVLALSFRE